MLQALDDYKVDFLREQSIASTALAWRKEASNANYAFFNIVDFVIRILAKKTKRPFKIVFFDAREGEKPAYVTFHPRTLHVDREVWRSAEEDGEPEARFIIAHEVGHLILHDHHAKAFSNNPDDRIRFAEKEYSAEWQANTFASYFLVPDHVMAAFRDFSELSKSCGANDAITRSRYEIVASKALKGRIVIQDGALCGVCGNFTVTSDGKCANAQCGN